MMKNLNGVYKGSLTDMYKAFNWMIAITTLTWVAIIVVMVRYASQ